MNIGLNMNIQYEYQILIYMNINMYTNIAKITY